MCTPVRTLRGCEQCVPPDCNVARVFCDDAWARAPEWIRRSDGEIVGRLGRQRQGLQSARDFVDILFCE